MFATKSLGTGQNGYIVFRRPNAANKAAQLREKRQHKERKRNKKEKQKQKKENKAELK